jgi:hypothetical protein
MLRLGRRAVALSAYYEGTTCGSTVFASVKAIPFASVSTGVKKKQTQMGDFRHLESLASFQNLLAVTVAVVLISLVLIWLSRHS